MALRDRDLVPNKKKKPLNRVILVVSLSVLLAFFIRLILHHFFFLPVVISESSMEPQLKSGSVVSIHRRFSEADIKPNQIVWISHPLNQSHRMMRRVKALPNDKVEIHQGKIFINDHELVNENLHSNLNQPTDPNTNKHKIDLPDAISKTTEASFFDQQPYKLTAHQFFVIADGTGLDSRHFGPISIDQILGILSENTSQ